MSELYLIKTNYIIIKYERDLPDKFFSNGQVIKENEGY
jgi:hypothetical protein